MTLPLHGDLNGWCASERRDRLERDPGWKAIRNTLFVRTGCQDPISAMAKLAKGLLATAWEGRLPVLPRTMAEHLHVRIVTEPACCAVRDLQTTRRRRRLVPIRGGFVLRIPRGWDEAEGAPSGRVTVCHELAHTWFYDTREAMPKRLVPQSNAEEVLCWLAAYRLLVPDDVLEPLDRLSSPEAILGTWTELAGQARVTLRCAVHRMLDRDLFSAPTATALIIREQPAQINWLTRPRHMGQAMKSGLWKRLRTHFAALLTSAVLQRQYRGDTRLRDGTRIQFALADVSKTTLVAAVMISAPGPTCVSLWSDVPEAPDA